MDPIQTVQTVFELATQLQELYENIKSAPTEIQDLHQHLIGLCTVLKNIKELVPTTNSDDPETSARITSSTEQEIYESLGPVLASCNNTFERLQAIAEKHMKALEGKSATKRRIKNFTWTMKDKEVAGLKTELETHKASLSLSLLVLGQLQSRDLATGQMRLETTTQDIDDKASDIQSSTSQLVEATDAMRIDTESIKASQVEIESALQELRRLVAVQNSGTAVKTDTDSTDENPTSNPHISYLNSIESIVHNPENPLFPTLTPRTPLEDLGEYFSSRSLSNDLVAQIPSLPQPIQIATRNHRLSSGFPYPWDLQPFDVTARDWLMFTQTLTDVGKLSSTVEALANGAAVGATFVPGGALLSLQARKAVLKARTAKQVKKGQENLDILVKGWNEAFFVKRGVVVYFEIPGSENWRDARVVDEDGFCVNSEESPVDGEELQKTPTVSTASVELSPVDEGNENGEGKEKKNVKSKIVGRYKDLKDKYDANEYYGRCRIVVVPELVATCA